jgi:two-component system, chemotaxis family, chemotaxis protein CheY
MPQQVPIVALIDDDPIFHFTTTRFIKALKIEAIVKPFYNGETALQYLNANSSTEEELPDIILLDINMPVVDGWMFLEAYREMTGQIRKLPRIYMVSSSIAPEDMKKAKDNPHVTDYLVKPVEPEQFLGLFAATKSA